VVSIEERKSLRIRADVALIQGIFGFGGERQGVIHHLNLSANEQVNEGHIPQACNGLVLVGGMQPSAQALKVAADRGAVGFVTGSIDDRAMVSFLGFDIGVAVTGDENVSMSVIVTEGFGALPMASRSDELFRKANGKSCSINGTTQVRAGAVRPEVLVFEAGLGDQDSGGVERRGLELGSRVKVIRVPYFGMNGVIEELPRAAVQIETGASARVARVKLDNGAVVMVARANLELV
jgi:hypothetical protein